MLVEKRPQRHPIKRTTSMTELPYDPSSSDPAPVVEFAVSPPTLTDSESSAALAIPKRVTRRHSADYSLHTTTTAATADTTLPFLKSCCLCQIRFIPGRDIYMYRGDSAFCSSDCRKKQMKHDDRKQRSTRAVPLSPASTPLEGETVATTAV